jgi:hypothetical protein
MTQEHIHASLDKMLVNPKSRNFLNHLVRAYLPVTNVEKVWDTPEKDFICVLTKEPLFSLQDILKGIQSDEFQKTFMENLKSMFDEKIELKSPIATVIGNRKMGVTGKNTTTFMSVPTFQAFCDWVITKSLKGDKHINWLISGINRKSFLKRAETINDVEIQNKIKPINKAKDSTAKYTLADASDALLKLKQKMEKNEN